MNYLPVADFEEQNDSQLFVVRESENSDSTIIQIMPSVKEESIIDMEGNEMIEMTNKNVKKPLGYDGISFSNNSNGIVQIDTTDGLKVTQLDSNKNAYSSKKSVAEGMMDIALLTANANQLRFLITYNQESKTYYVSVGLIILSLVLQVAVGIALIFKVRRQMKIRGRKSRASRTNDFLVGGVFLVTVINVFAASFTMTESPKLPEKT